MGTTDVNVSQETLEQIRARVLQEEDNQLHFERPPQIIKDIRNIIEEEITDVDIDKNELEE